MPLPEPVTAYLHRAAPGPRHARLRAELHANLHQAMLDHRVRGLSEHDAWTAALHDFGPPQAVHAAARPHQRPLRATLTALLLAATLGGAAYATAAQGLLR
ncbi:permease prefix domain 1-containing protein [Deinococcus maricopensis]|uniref:Uncharacterized protein n=1 Tax=Deinococcus maricopensis (strain DSM 21211 / LMG 22137 / NRRL B-23946 / LB-34) TaxID=709986 RepID=E8UB17_DEIML|nr:permease prefix domain 1-containing protein [Deinococcus maricopensis]ADV68256.1 hypothetical protein Deima_2623 [Deinococcus maricopensis DSM 21211]